MDYNFRRINQASQRISSLSMDYNNTNKKIAIESNLLFQLQAIEEKQIKIKRLLRIVRKRLKGKRPVRGSKWTGKDMKTVGVNI